MRLSMARVDGREQEKDGKERMGGKAKAKAPASRHSTLRPKPGTRQHGKAQTMTIGGGENQKITRVITIAQ